MKIGSSAKYRVFNIDFNLQNSIFKSTKMWKMIRKILKNVNTGG